MALRRPRGTQIVTARGKADCAHNGSKGKYTERELLEKRIKVAKAHHARSFEFAGTLYVLRCGVYVEWIIP